MPSCRLLVPAEPRNPGQRWLRGASRSAAQRNGLDSQSTAGIRFQPSAVVYGWVDGAVYGCVDGVLCVRRQPDYWPEGFALDMPVEETTKLFLDRLREFPPARPFRMRVGEVTPLGLVLTGATHENEQSVRALRDAFTVLLDIAIRTIRLHLPHHARLFEELAVRRQPTGPRSRTSHVHSPRRSTWWSLAPRLLHLSRHDRIQAAEISRLKRDVPRLAATHSSGFSSPSTVGISSETVGWICIARWMTV